MTTASRNIAVLFFIWWFSNNLYAIDSELFFKRFPSRLLCVEMVLAQHLVGILMIRTILYFRSPSNTRSMSLFPVSREGSLSSLISNHHRSFVFVGVLHYLGSLLTAASYSSIGAASTLMWKLTEPLSAMILKFYILRSPTPLPTVSGVFVVLFGTILFSSENFNIPAFSPILSSNIVFPLRNILLKLDQVSSGSNLSAEVRYNDMLIAALPMAVLVFMFRLFTSLPTPAAVLFLVRNGLYSNVYQLSSVALLAQIDPLSHSVLNTFKRFSGIIISMVVLQHVSSPRQIAGTTVAFVGFLIYANKGVTLRNFFSSPSARAGAPSPATDARKDPQASRNRACFLLGFATCLLSCLLLVVLRTTVPDSAAVPAVARGVSLAHHPAQHVPAVPAAARAVPITGDAGLSALPDNGGGAVAATKGAAQGVEEGQAVNPLLSVAVEHNGSGSNISSSDSVKRIVSVSSSADIALARAFSTRAALVASRINIVGADHVQGPIGLSPNSTSRVAYVFEFAYLEEAVRFNSFDDMSYDGNTGNMMWKYGARFGLASFPAGSLCTGIQKTCVDAAREYGFEKVVLLVPSANVLSPGKRLFKRLWQHVAKQGVERAIVIGIGVQHAFLKDSLSFDLMPGLRMETSPEDFELTPMFNEEMQAARDVAIDILVRGKFTQRVVERAGFDHAHVTGCPSLMVSRDVRLGMTLESKFQAVSRRVGDMSLRIAFNIKGSTRFMEVFSALSKKYPNSVFYAQTTHDATRLQEYGVPFERIRLFGNIPDWVNSLRGMEMSFGGRIHGTMAALAAGIPAMVISVDHRVLELAEEMKIPTISSLNGLFHDEYKIDVAQIFADYKFDGSAFDQNRCELAKKYKRVFSQVELPLSPHVEAISQLC